MSRVPEILDGWNLVVNTEHSCLPRILRDRLVHALNLLQV